jgi:hypothetical protein
MRQTTFTRALLLTCALIMLTAPAASAQQGDPPGQLLTVSTTDLSTRFRGINELRFAPGCVQIVGRTAVVTCTAGSSNSTASFGAQAANRFFAGPSSGSNAAPSWRAMVGLDLPSAIDAAKLADGTVSNAEFQRIDGLTSNAQAQLDAKAATAALTAHTSDTANPHAVTKSQVGLANVTNDAQLKIASNLSDLGSAATARTNLGVAIGTDVQGYDATLAALAAFNSSGIIVQTAADTFAARTLTGPAAGITVTNGSGVSGNPTLSLANDLSALEALSSTGIAVRTGTDAWAQRTITGTANQVTVTNGNGVSGNPTLSLPRASARPVTPPSPASPSGRARPTPPRPSTCRSARPRTSCTASSTRHGRGEDALRQRDGRDGAAPVDGRRGVDRRTRRQRRERLMFRVRKTADANTEGAVDAGEAMRIDRNRNVGVGTTSIASGQKLEVTAASRSTPRRRSLHALRPRAGRSGWRRAARESRTR